VWALELLLCGNDPKVRICDEKVLVSHMPLFAAASVLPISSLTVAYMENEALCSRWVLHLLASLSLSLSLINLILFLKKRILKEEYQDYFFHSWLTWVLVSINSSCGDST
jgi:hypothetical protein